MMFTIIHPTRRSLVRFAGGDSTDAERERVGRHVLTCGRCRETVAFARRIAGIAATLPVPAPSAALLDRVLVARSAGDRIILPTAEFAPDGRRGLLAAAALAAAALLLLTPAIPNLGKWRRPMARDGATAMDTSLIMRGSPFGGGFLTSVAGAQGLPLATESMPPAVVAIDGTRLRAGETKYEERWTDSSGRVQIAGRQSVRLTNSTFAGNAAWRLEHVLEAQDSDGRRRIEAETLWVDRRTLRPLDRRVHIAPQAEYRRVDLTQGFNGDSLIGHVTAVRDDARIFERSFLRRLDLESGPLVTDALSSVFLMSIELGPHWTGRLGLLGWALMDRDVVHTVTLRVTGVERITVPAGAFDCWRMSVSVDGHAYDVWVRQSDGLGVRTRDESARHSRGVREVLLVGA